MTRAKRIHKFVEESGDHIASSLQAQAARLAALDAHLDDEDVQDALAEEFGPTLVERIPDSFDRFCESRRDPSKF